MALRTAARLFQLAGDRRFFQFYDERQKKLTSRIKRLLFNKRTSVFHGGLDWKGKPVRNNSPHAVAFAILLDLFPEHQERLLKKSLLPLVRGNRNAPIVPSPYFMYYILQALKKTGHHAEVIDCITRWWGEMVDKGLTTTEEVWNGKPGIYSMCHAWSAHPIVHFSNILLGVWQEKENWKEVRISPVFTAVDSVIGSVATPHGPIEVAWRIEKGQAEIAIKVPRSIRARLDLPGEKPIQIKGKFRGSVKI